MSTKLVSCATRAMHYTVFSHAVHCYYKTTLFSKATVFYLLASVFTFIPPLLITYRSQGFWQRMDVYREQPEVHFKHEVLVSLEIGGDSGEDPQGDPQGTIGWSTYKNYNQILLNHARVPLIKESTK